MTLPADPTERKALQLYTFMFQYFPDAWLEVVRIARIGNEQHNPGEPLHWARDKSTDQMNAAFNHVFDYGLGAKVDADGGYHLAKAVWRLMAQLQLDIERTRDIAGANQYAEALQRPSSANYSYPLPPGADGPVKALAASAESSALVVRCADQPAACPGHRSYDEYVQAHPVTPRR